MYTFKLARDKSDRDQAATLVRRVYAKSGYIKEDGSTPITDFMYNEEQTNSVLALVDDKIVGTISLVQPGRDQLPMESLYASEIRDLDHPIMAVAEVCQFAVDKELLPKKFGTSKLFEAELALQLLALVISICRRKLISRALFTINPKHKSFYEALGARQFGAEKSYAAVNGAPALAYELDMDKLISGNASGLLLRAVEKIEPVAESLWR